MLKLTTLFVMLCFCFINFSQDYHHWSEQFGARASFLGGAAAAGLGDNATVYYNSAAMSFVETPSLSISVNAYRISNIQLKNALGNGYDLKETQLTTMPNLISGIYAPKKHQKVRFIIQKKKIKSRCCIFCNAKNTPALFGAVTSHFERR